MMTPKRRVLNILVVAINVQKKEIQNLGDADFEETQAKFHHQFHFTKTFKCFIRSSRFDVWCC